MQREDWDGALAELQRVLSMDADNPTLHNQIGDVHLRKGDVDQACDHFEMAVDLYSNLGLHNNAVALCRKVVRLAPTRVEVRYHLARLRMDQGLRSEAESAFIDYLEHAQPEDDEGSDALEQRCVDAVETFPDIAPVGQILEKLEALQRPQGAYRIVQRAAQRAADAGDKPAAKRLTEKMRSLRVLLESQGATPAPDEAVAEDNVDAGLASDAGKPDTETTSPEESRTKDVPDAAAPSATSQPPVARPRYTDPGAIELPAADSDAQAATTDDADVVPVDLPDVVPPPEAADHAPDEAKPPSVETPKNAGAGEDADVDVPEIDLDTADSLEDSMAAFQDDASSVDTPAGKEQRAPSADDDATAAADRQEWNDPSETKDASTMPEYELPETSLEEVADLLQQEGVEPTAATDASADVDAASDDRTPASPPSSSREVEDEADAPLLHGEDAASHTPQAASIAETFADPPSVSDDDVAEASAETLEEEDRPASVIYEPVPGARKPGSSGDDVRRQPVWIPSPDTVSEDPTPSEEGQTQELEEVIDTFREQMARALGDDGAARYDLGVAYYDMGLYNEALAEFEVAVKCPGLANRTLEMMAACLAQQGRHDEVVSLLEGPLAENDKPSTERLALQYAMGLALEAVGQQEDARRHFEEVALVDIGFKDVQSRLQR
jgi:tetratricopeptide (TPR) repeat protein